MYKSFARTSHFGATPKAAPNDLWRMSGHLDARAGASRQRYVTPNVNTLYGFGFLDLGPEPVILSLPDSKGLYYMVEVVDMWTNAFAYSGRGRRRATRAAHLRARQAPGLEAAN